MGQMEANLPEAEGSTMPQPDGSHSKSEAKSKPLTWEEWGKLPETREYFLRAYHMGNPALYPLPPDLVEKDRLATEAKAKQMEHQAPAMTPMLAPSHRNETARWNSKG